MASARATTVRGASGNPAPGASVKFLAASGQLGLMNGQMTMTVRSLMPAAANIFALHGSLVPVTYRLSPAWQ